MKQGRGPYTFVIRVSEKRGNRKKYSKKQMAETFPGLIETQQNLMSPKQNKDKHVKAHHAQSCQKPVIKRKILKAAREEISLSQRGKN